MHIFVRKKLTQVPNLIQIHRAIRKPYHFIKGLSFQWIVFLQLPANICLPSFLATAGDIHANVSLVLSVKLGSILPRKDAVMLFQTSHAIMGYDWFHFKLQLYAVGQVRINLIKSIFYARKECYFPEISALSLLDDDVS